MVKKLSIFILLLVLLFPFTARAITLRPIKFFVTIDPGAEQIVAMTVRNDEKERQTYSTKVLSADQNVKGATIFFEDTDEAESWVTVEPAQFVLGPDQSADIKFIIRAPGLASPGAHHLGLVVQKNMEKEKAVGVQGGVAALVTIQVAGVAEEKMAIKMDIGRYIWQKNFTINLDYSNTGNIDAGFKTVLSTINWRGEKVAFKETSFPSLLVKAKYKEAITLDLPGRWRLFGLYTVVADTVYGRAGETSYLSDKIIFISPQLIIGGILVIILAIIWRRKSRKKYVFFEK